MEPFSIISGTAGLVDVALRLIKYLRKFEEAADKIEEEIASLIEEIRNLVNVNYTVRDLWQANHDNSLNSRHKDAVNVEDLWKTIDTLLQQCQNTVQKLEVLLESVIGADGSYVTGKIDGIKKTLRKRSKEKDFQDIRNRLSTDQAGLQMVLSALGVVYTLRSSASSDLITSSLDELQRQTSMLQSQMDFLRRRLPDNCDDTVLRKSIISAQAVASLIPFNQHFDLPQPVSSIFTGRDTQLKQLKSMLDAAAPQNASTSQKRFVIYGLSGSGKTQFCCKFAQDNREHFWGVFWIDGSSYETAKHTFSRIAKIGGAEPNENAAKNWLACQQNPWLLVIDNADDPEVDVTHFFPSGERGTILMTTRNPSNKIHGTVGSRFFHFEKLEVDAAGDLLLRAADIPSPWNPRTRTSAAGIAEALVFLPLALIHAGKAIMDGLCSLDNYMDFYHRSWKRIRGSRNVSGYSGDYNANMSVYSSWEIVYLGLEAKKTEVSEDSIQLLKMFSYFYWEAIEVDMLVAAAKNPRRERENQDDDEKSLSDTATSGTDHRLWIRSIQGIITGYIERFLGNNSVLPAVLRDDESSPFDEDRLRTALTYLVQRGMLIYSIETGIYSMHPLVHTWTRERPQMSTGEQALWCQAAATTLSSSICFRPPSDYANLDERLKSAIFPHVEHLRKSQKVIRDRILGNQKMRNRSWLISWLAPFIVPSEIQPLENAKFSLVYLQAGQFNEAENLQAPVMEIALKRLGIEHPRTIDIMQLLSVTYVLQARNNRASDLQRQVLGALTNTYGPKHSKTLRMTDSLGATCLLQSRLREARILHERAVEGMTEILGENHEDTLTAVGNLGNVMGRYFLYEEAKELHLKASEGMKRIRGLTHLSTLRVMEHLAQSYLYLEDYEKAHQIANEVLDRREKMVGREHPYTLMARLTVARVKYMRGEADEAETIMRAGIPVGERNFGSGHLGVLVARTFLSHLLVRQQRYEEAEEILAKVIQRHRYEGSQREDGEHIDRIQALWFLLQCYQLQGKIDEAITVGDETWEALNSIGGEGLGQQHPFAKYLADKREELLAIKEGSSTTVSPPPYDPMAPSSKSPVLASVRSVA